jgi:hypothetical protein
VLPTTPTPVKWLSSTTSANPFLSRALLAAGALLVTKFSDSLSDAPDAVFRVWRYRLRIEFEASALFDFLSEDLKRLYGPVDLGASFAKTAADDELRHAERCRQILAHAQAPLPELTPSAVDYLGPRAASLQDRVLYTSVAIGCVTETLSTALLVEMHKRADPGLIKNTIHEILTDEVNHGRVGWAELSRQSLQRDVSWLHSFISPMIQEALTSDVKPMLTPATTTFQDLSRWGILPRSEALAIMEDTIEQVILPGLQHYGISAKENLNQTLSI